MFYCTQNQTVKETALLGVKDKRRLSLQIQLALKKNPNFPVLHGVLQRNVTITLVWGGMWENTLDRAPFLYEPFPPELAMTQQLARVREADCGPQSQKAWGLPLCVARLCHIWGPRRPSRPGLLWASGAHECLCWVQQSRRNMKVSPALEQRFLRCFTLVRWVT